MIDAPTAIQDGIETLKRRLKESNVQRYSEDELIKIRDAWMKEAETDRSVIFTAVGELVLIREKPEPDRLVVQQAYWAVIAEGEPITDPVTKSRITQIQQRATHWMVAEPWLIEAWAGEWR